jgi:hypothetical protein
VLGADADPLKALTDLRVPAIVLRGWFNPAHCSGIVARFQERQLMYDQQLLRKHGPPSVSLCTPVRRVGSIFSD